MDQDRHGLTPRQAVSQLGNAIRRGDPADTIADARRALTAAKLEASIRAAVDAAPPLTDQQRRNLALLLHPGPATEPAP